MILGEMSRHDSHPGCLAVCRLCAAFTIRTSIETFIGSGTNTRTYTHPGAICWRGPEMDTVCETKTSKERDVLRPQAVQNPTATFRSVDYNLSSHSV